jgi:WD40 repeat protein
MRLVSNLARRGPACCAALACAALLGSVAVAGPAAGSLAAAGRARPAGSGAQLWLSTYAGPGSDFDVAFAMAVSPARGVVYVTGSSEGPGSALDYATVAYDASTGAQLWVSRYDGQGVGNDQAQSIAVSPDGSRIFVTGYSAGATGSYDYATVAYDALTGAQLWVSRYNGPGDGNDEATSVAVSPAGGRVFVTGRSDGAGPGQDYATIAYDAATGAQLWLRRYNGPGNSQDAAWSVAVGPRGGTVFVTGASSRTGTVSGDDYTTIAYNAATGVTRWLRRYNGPADLRDQAHFVVVGPRGREVFVTGRSEGRTSGFDYATVAYDAATGARLWARRYGGKAGRTDEASWAAVSPGGGRVYVTGFSRGTTSGRDYATVAYDAATGAQLWARRYNGPAGRDDDAKAVAAGPGGKRVYVTGYSEGRPGSDYATIAYNAATGARLWASRLHDVNFGLALALAVSPGGRMIFVTGRYDYHYGTVAYRA